MFHEAFALERMQPLYPRQQPRRPLQHLRLSKDLPRSQIPHIAFRKIPIAILSSETRRVRLAILLPHNAVLACQGSPEFFRTWCPNRGEIRHLALPALLAVPPETPDLCHPEPPRLDSKSYQTRPGSLHGFGQVQGKTASREDGTETTHPTMPRSD